MQSKAIHDRGKTMSAIICPVCGLTEFDTGVEDNALVAAAVWTEAFTRQCHHAQERRHRADLKAHACPHWAGAVEDETTLQMLPTDQRR